MYNILDPNSDFLCLSFFTFSVGIIACKHSIAHPLWGLGDIQGSYYCTQHAHTYRIQGRSQEFRKGGANLLVYDYITRVKKVIPRNPLIYYKRECLQ